MGALLLPTTLLFHVTMQLRKLVQTNPSSLPVVWDMIGKASPALLSVIDTVRAAGAQAPRLAPNPNADPAALAPSPSLSPAKYLLTHHTWSFYVRISYIIVYICVPVSMSVFVSVSVSACASCRTATRSLPSCTSPLLTRPLSPHPDPRKACRVVPWPPVLRLPVHLHRIA